MTFKEAITAECDKYAKENNAIFIGYNTLMGSRMYGTLRNIPDGQCIESPVAENLMCGLATGLALEGFRPVVCFERHDFLLLGLDAIVNHIDKLSHISGDQFKLPIVIRAIVGSKEPIDPGPMHRQDYTHELCSMLKYTEVYRPISQTEVREAWLRVDETQSGTVIIIEKKDWYEREIPYKI